MLFKVNYMKYFSSFSPVPCTGQGAWEMMVITMNPSLMEFPVGHRKTAQAHICAPMAHARKKELTPFTQKGLPFIWKWCLSLFKGVKIIQKPILKQTGFFFWGGGFLLQQIKMLGAQCSPLPISLSFPLSPLSSFPWIIMTVKHWSLLIWLQFLVWRMGFLSPDRNGWTVATNSHLCQPLAQFSLHFSWGTQAANPQQIPENTGLFGGLEKLRFRIRPDEVYPGFAIYVLCDLRQVN